MGCACRALGWLGCRLLGGELQMRVGQEIVDVWIFPLLSVSWFECHTRIQFLGSAAYLLFPSCSPSSFPGSPGARVRNSMWRPPVL